MSTLVAVLVIACLCAQTPPAPVALVAGECTNAKLGDRLPLAAVVQQLEKARALEDLSGLRAAVRQLEELAVSHKEDAVFLLYAAEGKEALVMLYEIQNNRKEAKEALDEAFRYVERSLAVHEASSDGYALRASLYGWKIAHAGAFSRMFSGMKYGPKIRDDLNRAEALDAANPAVHLSIGRDYFFKPGIAGGSFEKAVQHFKKATELAPKCVEGWIWLGMALAKQEKRGEAREALDKALKLSPQNVWAKREIAKMNNR